MSSETWSDIALKPPVEWSNSLAGVGCSPSSIRHLDSLIIALVRLRAYAEATRVDNQTHGQGIDAQNKLAAKVRRVLGYSCPQDVKTW